MDLKQSRCVHGDHYYRVSIIVETLLNYAINPARHRYTTGINEAYLERMGSMEKVEATIFEIEVKEAGRIVNVEWG